MVETLDDKIEYFIGELISEEVLFGVKYVPKYTEEEIIKALENNVKRLKGKEVEADDPI